MNVKEIIENLDSIKKQNRVAVTLTIIRNIDLYIIVKECTSFLPENAKVAERLYCIRNEIKEVSKCKGCGNKTKFDVVNPRRGYLTYCSVKCAVNSFEFKQIKIQTCLEKYGVESPLESSLVQEKKKQTCLEKYGVDNPWKSAMVKSQRKQTWLKNYGVDNPGKSKQVREKTKQTCLERYGVDYSFMSNECKEKKIQTCLKRYGTLFPYADTSIEIALQDALRKENIEFETQKLICGLPDIFIKPNICIFADGDYWHNYPNGNDRDIKVNATLTRNGYKVLRFWERDIKTNLNGCVEKIKNVGRLML